MALRLLATALVALQIFFVPLTQAAPVVIHNTFGPGDSFINGLGWAAADPGNGANYVSAERFSPSSSGLLDSVTLALRVSALQSPFEPQSQIRLSILSDADGLPGALLDYAVVDLTTGFPGDPSPAELVSFQFGVDTPLLAGAHYWLALGAVLADPDFLIVWARNDQLAVGPRSFSGALFQAPGEWFLPFDAERGAARVVAQAISEPQSLALAVPLLALVLVAFAKRRRDA